MPTSHLFQITTIIQLIDEMKPQSILDIGFGFGKYGFLAREYLEVWEYRYQRSDWRIRIDGIEGFQPYATELQKYIYNQLFFGDALTILTGMKAQEYQLALAIDVLEHMNKVAGSRFISECRRVSRQTIISTPKKFFNQDAIFNNKFEIHKSVWYESELKRMGAKKFIPDPVSIIAVF